MPVFRHLYKNFIPPFRNLTTFLFPFLYPPPYSLHTWRITVSAGIIAGIVLVFLLLGYLFYALFHAEAL